MRNRKTTCPFCGETFDETCEYVDVGVGFVQGSPNICESCGSWEKYPDDDGERPEQEYKGTWTRLKK